MDRNRGGVSAVGGVVALPVATYTRPNNTTAYTAGDQLADSTSAPTVLTFSDAGRISGGSGWIIEAQCVDSVLAVTKAELELWLWSVAPVPANDNAAASPTDTEMLSLVGIFSFASWYAGGVNAVSFSAEKNKLFLAQSLSGTVVVRNAYTPTALEEFRFTLFVSQD